MVPEVLQDQIPDDDLSHWATLVSMFGGPNALGVHEHCHWSRRRPAIMAPWIIPRLKPRFSLIKRDQKVVQIGDYNTWMPESLILNVCMINICRSVSFVTVVTYHVWNVYKNTLPNRDTWYWLFLPNPYFCMYENENVEELELLLYNRMEFTNMHTACLRV